MARSYAKVKGSIWRDQDWCQLPTEEQRLYLLLVSQPDITNCGVIPYLPTRWARLASDTTVDDVERIAGSLQARRFIVVDDDTCEVLVRTFVKHDQVLEQPKIKAAAARQYDGIQSARIRTALAEEYPDVFRLAPGEERHPEPYGKGTGNPNGSLSEGYPSRARGIRQPATLQPQPASSNQQPADPANPSPPADDDLEQTLGANGLGWKPWQITRAREHPDLAIAWAQHALTDPTIDNPGGYAWANYEAGKLAPALAHPCPTCGSTFKSPERLAEHIDHVHTEHERTELPPEVAALVAGTPLKDVEPKPKRKRERRPEPSL